MGGRRRLRSRRVVAIVVATVVLGGLTACSGVVDGSGARDNAALSQPAGSAPASPGATAGSDAPAVTSCPTSYAPPDPRRPKVSLTFAVSRELSTVQGTEILTFHPDLPITELVFRLTANTRPSVQEGNKIVVKTATASPGGGRFTFSAANADPATQGGLLHIPLSPAVPAGGTVTAQISFTVTLGADSFDRFGTTGGFAYFGSAQPLLAWERGFGWHTEDMIDFTAESATSEAMGTDLEVTAPAKEFVIASGNPAEPRIRSDGMRVWTSHLDAARDVAVSVGPYVVADEKVGGVALRVGAATPEIRDALVPEFRRAITELATRFGPFPFPSLAVARVPAAGGGIEYPGSILMLDGSRLVAVHETAHQWFYGMVGDSQSLHPWLDEAFASYAQELVDGGGGHAQDLSAPGDVDSSTQSYGTDERGYYFTTYNKGSAALEAARDAAGPAKFDAAIKCYVAKNAWRIANPKDLAAALADLPPAISVLTKAGALN